MNRPNVIFGTLGLAISAYVFFTASKFPMTPGANVGPGYYPMLLAAGLAALSAGLLIRSLLKMDNESFEKLDIKSPEIRRSFIALVATVLYALGMQFLGFIFASILYLFALMFLLRNRAYVKMSLVSIGVSVSVYFIFSRVLNLTLPLGFFVGG